MSGVPSSENTGRSTEKPSGFSMASQRRQRAAFGRRDGGAADEDCEVFGGIGGKLHDEPG